MTKLPNYFDILFSGTKEMIKVKYSLYATKYTIFF